MNRQEDQLVESLKQVSKKSSNKNSVLEELEKIKENSEKYNKIFEAQVQLAVTSRCQEILTILLSVADRYNQMNAVLKDRVVEKELAKIKEQLKEAEESSKKSIYLGIAISCAFSLLISILWTNFVVNIGVDVYKKAIEIFGAHLNGTILGGLIVAAISGFANWVMNKFKRK